MSTAIVLHLADDWSFNEAHVMPLLTDEGGCIFPSLRVESARLQMQIEYFRLTLEKMASSLI